MPPIARVVVVALKGAGGAAKKVLRATIRGKVLVVARVLGGLGEPKFGHHQCFFLYVDMKLYILFVTFIDQDLVGIVVPTPLFPSWKLRVLHWVLESTYTDKCMGLLRNQKVLRKVFLFYCAGCC